MKTLNKLLLTGVFCACIGFMTHSSTALAATPSDCTVDQNWITSPSMPTEVKKSGSDGTSNFCDFYQFSWQAYFYLMSPVTPGSDTRQFQVTANFPLIEFNADGSPANSCDDVVDHHSLRTGLDKTQFTTHQAGGGDVIFDQHGNAAFYDMRFNRAMCDLSGSAVEQAKKGITNFPTGTTELKFGWKILSTDEISAGTFLTKKIEAGELAGKTLGLIGMHLAIATDDHPEFVWASFEHNDNAPNCGETSNRAWSFTSQQCASKLPGAFTSKDPACNFNKAEKTSNITGTPSEVCRQYPDGTANGDLKANENRADITATNTQAQKYLAAASDTQMQLLKNYFILGALWVSHIDQDSDIGNQRGSLRLANPIAETTFQNVDLNAGFISNCFGCHNYAGSKTANPNNITSGNLSHIFFDIQTGQGNAVDIQTSKVIMNNTYAKDICESTCSSYDLSWNGNWTNEVTGTNSVCGCKAK